MNTNHELNFIERRYLFFGIFTSLVVWSAVAGNVVAQETLGSRIASKVDDSVVAVVYLDLVELQLDGAFKKLVDAGLIADAEIVYYEGMKLELQETLDGLKAAGAESIYSCLSISNWSDGGPVLHVSTKPNANVREIKRLINGLLKPALGAAFDEYAMGTGKNSVVVAPSKSKLDQVLAIEGETRKAPEAKLPTEAWSELGDGTFGLIVFGNQDVRRVVRELMPRLEEPFAKINGPMVADQVKWFGLAVTANNETQNAKMVVETEDRETASTIRQALSDARLLLKEPPAFWALVELEETEKNLVLDALEPQQVGNRVTLSLDKVMSDFENFAKMLKGSITKFKLATVGVDRERRLQTIALAMLNYESAYEHFPPAYSVDENGKPLLSWRVLVLPFIDGQLALYEKFKLDEPWDSPHNLPLVKEMPSFLRDPSPVSATNNAEGKTVFQVPFGEGLMFESGKERQFKEVLDGTSNTLLCVVVAPKEAVQWSKPSDWLVDLDDPTAKLRGEGRTMVEAARGDGSTGAFSLNKSKKYWQQMLQIADGEVPVED